MVFNRFRWVFCQLEVLQNCLPQNIRRVLGELPASLDETYERMLREILKANPDQAYRLLQCLTVATRPLRIEELAEVLALDFDGAKDGIPAPNEGGRWENQRQDVLSTCSSLIVVVNAGLYSVVQFAHFSVKEFLTSDRLVNLHADISRFHIRLEPAHTVIAQACLAILLHPGYNHRVKDRFPLSYYAAAGWVDHAQFENVSLRVADGMRRLFDPAKSHFTAWLNSYDLDREWKFFVRGDDLDPSPHWPSKFTSLGEADAPLCMYYAALCGFRDLTKHLIDAYPSHLNARVGRNKSPLVAALHNRHFQVAELLHQHGAVLPIGYNGYTLLHAASMDGSMDVAQWLLDIGADASAEDDDDKTPLHLAAAKGRLEVVQILLGHSMDVNVTAALDNHTPLHEASQGGHLDVVRLLIQNGADIGSDLQKLLLLASWSRSAETVQFFIWLGADVNARDESDWTPLHVASSMACDETVRILIEHGADINARDQNHMTPLHLASSMGYAQTVQLLIELGLDVNARDGSHSTPLHLASSDVHGETMRILIEHGADVHARDQNQSTALHVVSSSLELPWLWLYAETTLRPCVCLLIEQGAIVNAYDRDHKTPLHLAVSSQLSSWDEDTEPNANFLRLLLENGADVNVSDDNGLTPFQIAKSKGYHEIAQLLLDHGASVE